MTNRDLGAARHWAKARSVPDLTALSLRPSSQFASYFRACYR